MVNSTKVISNSSVNEKLPLFKNSAQYRIFKGISRSFGYKKAIEEIENILLFKSYIQVRAFEAGASISEALEFQNIIQLRAFEAGAKFSKALKTSKLEYVKHLERKAGISPKSVEINSLEYFDYTKEKIFENLSLPTEYQITFDIDDVICREVASSKSAYIVNEEWVQTTYPGVEIIKWQHENNERTYFCFPDFDKLVLIILSQPGWSVNFFSAEISERNEFLIPKYFSDKFGDDNLFRALLESRKLKIFSAINLTKENTHIPGITKLVKDLSVISNDVDNIILIDDTVSNAAQNQELVIGLSIEASKEIVPMVAENCDRTASLPFNPLKNAAYVLGIIFSAKELLDNNKAMCLREALDIVLQHNMDTSKCDSPWHIYPLCSIENDTSYISSMNSFIGIGDNIFSSF